MYRTQQFERSDIDGATLRAVPATLVMRIAVGGIAMIDGQTTRQQSVGCGRTNVVLQRPEVCVIADPITIDPVDHSPGATAITHQIVDSDDGKAFCNV